METYPAAIRMSAVQGLKKVLLDHPEIFIIKLWYDGTIAYKRYKNENFEITRITIKGDI